MEEIPDFADPSTIVEARTVKHEAEDPRDLVAALTILWHDDLGRVGKVGRLGDGITEITRKTPPFDVGIDVTLSRQPFLVVEYHQGTGAARLRPGGTSMEIWLEGKVLDSPQQLTREQLAHGVILTLGNAMVVCLHALRVPVVRGPSFGLVGGSDALETVRQQIVRVADLDVPVLLRGESGTGKELAARAIATQGRRAGAFVQLNIAQLSASTAAAELFGHEKGAFTGATEARGGVFVRADGGTLFLDEIGATPPEVQPMLLRVLEDWEIRPLGGSRPRRVKVRLITATDANLETAVKEGRFSEALFERLAGYQIWLPPLRERRQDLGPMFLHFLREKLTQTNELGRVTTPAPGEGPWLSASVAGQILAGAWPGNARRLRNVAAQLVISSRGKDFAELDATVRALLVPSRTEDTASRPAMVRVTDDEIRRALVDCNYNQSAAAKALGINRSSLYERIQDNPLFLRAADQIGEDELLAAHALYAGDVAAMARELRCSPKPLKKRISDVLKTRK